MAKYLIVGCPNTGKTTLFNNITGAKEKTANYSGVTVKEKVKTINYKNQTIEIVDLPGLYSLENLTSEDEQAAKNYLENHKNENIILLCSSSTINKNLVLLSELINNGYKNLKIIVNKTDKGLDESSLIKANEIIGAPIIQVDARKDKNKILDFIVSSGVEYLNNNLKLDKLLKLFPKDIQSLKKIDKVLLKPILGKLIFFIVLGLIVYISYGTIGNKITNIIENFLFPKVLKVAEFLYAHNLKICADFFESVIVGGILGVVVYLPQLALMLTLIYMLEDSGYLPRVAANFNSVLKKCGMDGKAVFSLIMGFGCTTSAVLCTRNIDNKFSKLNTNRFLPFIGCSAKLPIFMMIASMITKGKGILLILLLYLISIIVGISHLKISNNELDDNSFVVELPNLKLPNLKRCMKEAVVITIDLFKRVILSVGIIASIIWFLGAVSVDFKFLSGGKSILYLLSEKIGKLFKPIGLNYPSFIVALITGIIAKENVLSVLGVLGEFEISAIQGISFLIFIMLYTPCVASLKCISSEFGKKEVLKTFARTCLSAYLSAFIFYTFALIHIVLGFIMLVLTWIVFAFGLRTLGRVARCAECKTCKKRLNNIKNYKNT